MGFAPGDPMGRQPSVSLEEKQPDMAYANDLALKLQQAATLPETLAVCVAAFEAIRQTARRCETAEPNLFAAFMSAASAAADGLDALAACPVELPQPAPSQPTEITGELDDVADALAELAAILADRLDRLRAQPSEDDTRAACQDAARSARQIRELMART